MTFPTRANCFCLRNGTDEEMKRYLKVLITLHGTKTESELFVLKFLRIPDRLTFQFFCLSFHGRVHVITQRFPLSSAVVKVIGTFGKRKESNFILNDSSSDSLFTFLLP